MPNPVDSQHIYNWHNYTLVKHVHLLVPNPLRNLSHWAESGFTSKTIQGTELVIRRVEDLEFVMSNIYHFGGP